MTDTPSTTDDQPVEPDEETADRPGTAAEEAGIVDQQAVVLEDIEQSDDASEA
jgi:hypothetical protein